jgi:SH3-like domain-containing protein
VHYQLLSGVRTVIVDEHRLPLRMGPTEDSREIALLERNVIARLETCEPDWCRVSAGGYGGWVPKSALWGVKENEVLD